MSALEQVIVINKDPKAAIFDFADCGGFV